MTSQQQEPASGATPAQPPAPSTSTSLQPASRPQGFRVLGGGRGQPSPIPSAAATATTPTATAAESAGRSPLVADPLESSPPAAASTRSPAGSSGGTGKVDAGTWADIFSGLFEQAARVLHNVLATSQADQDGKVWLADEGEAQKVGEPLGGIAARRAQLPGGADATDALRAAAVLAAYGLRNAGKAVHNRRLARRARNGTLPLPDLVEYHPTT